MVMTNLTLSEKTICSKEFFNNVNPIKLTESKKIKLHEVSWSLITEYYLESVKVNCTKTGERYTAATLKCGDESGEVVCLVKGPSVGLLFGLNPEEWLQVEQLCGNGQQLFYRYFRDGLKNTFSYEQKLFYNFCVSNQTKNMIIAIFRRGTNTRNKDKNNAFLEIMKLKKCNSHLLDLYISHLRNNSIHLPT